MATVHKVGDTGNFGNWIYVGFPLPNAGESLTPLLENDLVLGDVDRQLSGDYLNQQTVMQAVRTAGMSAATIGKLGPALIFDHTERSGEPTIVVDDKTGSSGGIPVSGAALVMADAALTVVMVGNMGCALMKCTPFFIRATSAGAA
jgi:hypothetical protein